MPPKRKAPAAKRQLKYPHKRARLAIVNPQQSLRTTRTNFKTINLKYADLQQFTAPTGGSYSYHRWRASGPYDPDKTGVGHQPLGYQQNADLYDRYVVNGAKCTVYCTWDDTNSGGPLYLGVGLANNNTNWTTAHNAIENGADIKALLGYTSPAQEVKCTAFYSAPKVYGTTGDMLRLNANATSVVGGLPNNIDDFNFVMFHPSTSVPVSAGVYVRIEIEYNITFFEPKRTIAEDP